MRCPTCSSDHKPLPGGRLGPFCSSRCQLIDLGRWLDEEYRVPDSVEVSPEDLEAAMTGLAASPEHAPTRRS